LRDLARKRGVSRKSPRKNPRAKPRDPCSGPAQARALAKTRCLQLRARAPRFPSREKTRTRTSAGSTREWGPVLLDLAQARALARTRCRQLRARAPSFPSREKTRTRTPARAQLESGALYLLTWILGEIARGTRPKLTAGLSSLTSRPLVTPPMLVDGRLAIAFAGIQPPEQGSFPSRGRGKKPCVGPNFAVLSIIE
jgi:hypothetical protein